MNNDEINALIDSAIDVNADKIDIKELSGRLVSCIQYSDEDVRDLIREKIEQKARTRISGIKGADLLRNFFATPVDGRKGVYTNAPKSSDDIALEKAGELLDVKIVGLKASRDKLYSTVFKIRHNVEIKDDATLDLKVPYDSNKDTINN